MEVKYRAPNEVQRGYANFATYTKRADLFTVDAEQIAATGYYELVRNWRIGAELAERRGCTLTLINLGPHGLAARTPGFVETLASTPARSFAFLSSSHLLAAAQRMVEFPGWLKDFVDDRGLSGRWA